MGVSLIFWRPYGEGGLKGYFGASNVKYGGGIWG